MSAGFPPWHALARSPKSEVHSWQAPHKFTRILTRFVKFHSIIWVDGHGSSNIWGNLVLEMAETETNKSKKSKLEETDSRGGRKLKQLL